MTLLDIPRSLSGGSDPGVLGKGYKARQHPDPQSHTYTAHASSPPSAVDCGHGTEAHTAVTSGLVKPDHSSWTRPEAVVGRGGGRGVPAESRVTASVVSLFY